MSDDSFGPGLSAADFMDGLARQLGIDQQPAAQDMQMQMRHRVEKDRAMAAKVLKTFSTKDGADTLEWLLSHTLRKGEVPVDLVLTHTPDQVQAFALVRAGENAIVSLILEAMAQAKQKPSRRRKAV